MGEGRDAYRILVGRPEGRRPFGRPRRRWENIKMDLQKLVWGAWTELIWLSIGTGCCECGNELSGSIKRGKFLDYLTIC
jgi:hypothetical protein